MNDRLIFALVASIISSIGGLAGGLLLFARERVAHDLSRFLTSFAAGVLLSVTFFDLLPEAAEAFTNPASAFAYVLVGIVAFFLVERAIASVHGHEHQAEDSASADAAALRRARPLVIVGDTIHNFIDGVTVAVTFIASVPLGIATATSVLLHELPHEIADFTILLRTGSTRQQVLLINFFSALVAPLGTLVAYFYASQLVGIQKPLLAIAAGNLLYIAMTDLIPHLHHETRGRRVVLQTLLFILGVLTFAFIPRN